MLKIDLHLHTVASGHAHNTILEYINQAIKLKMKIIGFTDHGPSMNDNSNNETYFKVISRMPKYINGLRILKGIEANIIDTKGHIDISDNVIFNKLDYVIAFIHSGTTYKNSGIKGNTKALIGTIKSGKVNIISHPFVKEYYNLESRVIYEEACKQNILLEMNLHYIEKKELNPERLAQIKDMVKIVKKYNKKLIVNSDAHNIWEMGDDSNLIKIKKGIGLTNDMIINNYPKELLKILKINE